MSKDLKRAIKPIKSKKDYHEALRLIDKYFYARPGTAEAKLVEVLSILAEKYEDEHFPIEAPDPIEAIKFRMDQLGLNRKDIANLLGGMNRVSEIFNRKRRLTIPMIKSLNKELGVPAESLLG